MIVEKRTLSESTRILMTATSYPASSSDWQGRFIFDLAQGIAAYGAMTIRLWAPPGILPAGVEAATSAADQATLRAMAHAGGIAHLLRNRPVRGLWMASKLLWVMHRACEREHPDLYHINWLQNALALPDDGRPALVTVLGTDFRLLRLPGMVWMLRRVFRRRRVLLAPNAEWMVAELRRHFGDLCDVREIPFGVDAPWFQVERVGAGQRDWIAVIRLTRAKLGDLLTWGNGLFGPESGRRLHLFGPRQEKIDLPDWVEWHGPTHPQELREYWFPRAAGMLTLSRHAEGRPQVLLEAMAAGVPVLASAIPAHCNLITHRETGWLCDSPKEFAAGLAYLEHPEHALAIGQAGKRWVTNALGNWVACGKRYGTAYKTLLNEDA